MGLILMLLGGYVPNFATLNGSTLNLSPGQMQLYASPRMVKGSDPLKTAMHELVSSGRPVSMSATTEELLKGGEGGSHTKKIKALIRFIAEQKGGPSLFERDFKVSELPYRGNKGPDEAETAVAKAINKERGLKGKHKFINTGKKPGSPGDKSFPVDLIGLGMDPLEVKSGEWSQPNLLLKSLRLYSDDDLMSFAERQYGASPEMLTEARREKLGKSSRLLIKKGLLDPDASLKEQHKAAIKYGIAGGFVPNYLNQTDKEKEAEWVAIAAWLEAQKGRKIARSESLDEMKKAGVKVSTTDAKSMADKWSRLLGDATVSENRSVQATALKALGEASYQKLLGNAAAILPVAPRAGAAPSIGPHMPLPSKITWKAGEPFKVNATLKDIMSKPGGKSLANIHPNSRGAPGAAFKGTHFGEKKFNALAKKWKGQGGLLGLKSTSYKALIKPWHPYDGATKKPLSQTDLQNAGIGDLGFEQLIDKAGGFGTPTSSDAPLDFIGPNGEAKFVKGIKSTGEQGTAAGFYWSQIIGKILRSKIGNSMLTSATTAPQFQGMWGPNQALGANLFAPELASGLIPNFADNRTRGQKISDVLGDPSNAGINFKGGALKPRSIKSKNMFQKMWLESYFKTGLAGDYQMLMKMGYNPDELLSLRGFAKKGGKVNVLGKGFVPNFANPLKEAIARESGAGIPKSQIKVEQSDQLRGPGNPMGLAVTNKRDEPMGVGQGIRRARVDGYRSQDSWSGWWKCS